MSIVQRLGLLFFDLGAIWLPDAFTEEIGERLGLIFGLDIAQFRT